MFYLSHCFYGCFDYLKCFIVFCCPVSSWPSSNSGRSGAHKFARFGMNLFSWLMARMKHCNSFSPFFGFIRFVIAWIFSSVGFNPSADSLSASHSISYWAIKHFLKFSSTPASSRVRSTSPTFFFMRFAVVPFVTLKMSSMNAKTFFNFCSTPLIIFWNSIVHIVKPY